VIVILKLLAMLIFLVMLIAMMHSGSKRGAAGARASRRPVRKTSRIPRRRVGKGNLGGALWHRAAPHGREGHCLQLSLA